ESWITKSDPAALQAKVLNVLDRFDMRLKDDSKDEIVATKGSQFLTRLLGAWFVPARWLPIRATVRMRRTANGVRIRARFEETMGFGILDPITRNKYEFYFGQILNELRAAIEELEDASAEEFDE